MRTLQTLVIGFLVLFLFLVLFEETNLAVTHVKRVVIIANDACSI